MLGMHIHWLSIDAVATHSNVVKKFTSPVIAVIVVKLLTLHCTVLSFFIYCDRRGWTLAKPASRSCSAAQPCQSLKLW
jgi:hypothetical protein